MSLYHVKIHYGPCKSLNDVIYRPRKLKGIRMRLQKLGYRVDCVPESYRDYCSLEVCGHEVFRCNVRYLKFNTSVERDPVAQRAVRAVLAGTKACIRARTNLWLRTMVMEETFRRNAYSPKDHWLFPMNLNPLVYECQACCGSLSIGHDKRKEVMPLEPQQDYFTRYPSREQMRSPRF